MKNKNPKSDAALETSLPPDIAAAKRINEDAIRACEYVAATMKARNSFYQEMKEENRVRAENNQRLDSEGTRNPFSGGVY